MDFSVIIPALNEGETIGKILGNLMSVLSPDDRAYEIIVVDDGSTDNTFSTLQGMSGVKVIRHPYNKGNGAAVKTGILMAKGRKIIVIDADGQHEPGYILEMLHLLDDYDLVVGARESFGIGRRGFGNRYVSKLASYLSGITIPDLTSGFRAFKKEIMLEFIDLLPNGFSLPSTSTLAFAVNGYNIKFIPIKSIVRQGGKSSINVYRDGTKFIVLIFRMISLFNPLKVFVPVSIMSILIGLLWAVRTLMYSFEITPTVVMFILVGIFLALFGLLADQVAETRLLLSRVNRFLIKKMNKDID